uniref:Uncharacterized protein n=1 Tax=Globodera rostochiensis TaxID=31243 RepID=A0A914I946_GLORO
MTEAVQGRNTACKNDATARLYDQRPGVLLTASCQPNWERPEQHCLPFRKMKSCQWAILQVFCQLPASPSLSVVSSSVAGEYSTLRRNFVEQAGFEANVPRIMVIPRGRNGFVRDQKCFFDRFGVVEGANYVVKLICLHLGRICISQKIFLCKDLCVPLVGSFAYSLLLS